MRSRERDAVRVAELRERAASLDAAAPATSEGMVPERGQPILVGHHSEQAHRRTMARAARRWDRQAAEAREAEALRTEADALERRSASAIYDDDPDAVERLGVRIADAETQIAALKDGANPSIGTLARRDHVAFLRRQVRALAKRRDQLALARLAGEDRNR